MNISAKGVMVSALAMVVYMKKSSQNDIVSLLKIGAATVAIVSLLWIGGRWTGSVDQRFDNIDNQFTNVYLRLDRVTARLDRIEDKIDDLADKFIAFTEKQ